MILILTNPVTLLKAFVAFAISFYVNRLYFYPKCALGAMAYILYCDVSKNV